VALTFPVDPMRAVLSTLPPDSDDDNWAYEIKWDGYRTLCFVDTDKGIRLQSSNRLDVTKKYPELAELPASVDAKSAVLDGELVVFDDNGRPTFELMQRHETPVVFQVFDVLSIGGKDVIAQPYEKRRELLATLVEQGGYWSVPGHRIGGGKDLLAAATERDLEGVMAKRLGSPYQPGKRTPNWRKVKIRREVEVVVGGYTGGTGTRASSFGALLVGVPGPDGALKFAGGVGTGYTQATLDELLARLRTLRIDTCPFSPTPPREYTRNATWVDPVLVARIQLTEFTNEGFVRHASFLGIERRVT
jgi:bifunctional non-homologous end joining protein LigD